MKRADHNILFIGLELIDTALEQLGQDNLTQRDLRAIFVNFAVSIE